MGHSYKGASCPPGNLSLWAAPTITSGSTGVVTVTPNSGNPQVWRLDFSPDGGVTWLFSDEIAGTARTFTGIGSGATVSALGAYADLSEQTQRSNTIVVS